MNYIYVIYFNISSNGEYRMKIFYILLKIINIAFKTKPNLSLY